MFRRAAVLSVSGVFASIVGADDGAITSELIATGLNNPTFVASLPGDASRLYVVEKYGRVRLIKDGVVQTTAFLDIDSLVPNQTWNGLLGLCFDPAYDTNGFFYVQHTLSGNRVSVARYQVSANPDVADAASRETVLERSFPGTGHHVGGWIGFGPDGYLYIPLGDGGTTGDAAGGTRSQSLTSLWGKMLRVDVHGDDAYPGDANRNYAIPPDNPFIGAGLGEIYARGLRNPFRADFDDVTGDLWIADVGLYGKEEVNVIEAGSGGGQNFGWSCAEGTNCSSNSACSCSAGLTGPVYEYTHAFGCSISGGSVYDGCAIEGMQGRYFFGDWCSGRVWSCRYENGTAVDLIEHTSALNHAGQPTIGGVTGIGVDGNGELIIVSDQGNLFRIVPEADHGGCACAGDLDGNGDINGGDLGIFLALWGTTNADADLNGDGQVNGGDLGYLLSYWGGCS